MTWSLWHGLLFLTCLIIVYLDMAWYIFIMLSTHLPIFSTHLPTNRRKLSRPTAVGRCVLKFRPTVGLIPRINADSNVESAVDASLQSAFDKDVSGVGCDESAYIRRRVGWCVLVKKKRRSAVTWPIRR